MNELVLFDYSQLDQDSREFVQSRADNIRSVMKQTAWHIVEVGQWLTEVKERLPHGAWLPWLQVEFGWTRTTANNYMNTYAKLQNFCNLQIEPSAMYLLAAPKCPPEAFDNLIERAQNGEIVTHKAAKETISKAKQAKKRKDNIPKNHTGTIILYNGDMLQIVPTLEDNSINLVVTDPPYNVKNDTEWEGEEVEWDKLGTSEEFLLFTKSWLDIIKPKLKDNYHLFFFCDPDYSASIEMLLREDKWPLKSRIIWEYRNLVKGRDAEDRFIENWQMCFHIGNHPLNWSEEWDDKRFMVQQHATPQTNFDEGKHHPTQKPLSLIKILVEVGSKPGDMVIDPFAGSGTTGLACIDRDYILIERNEEYTNVIEERLGIVRYNQD